MTQKLEIWQLRQRQNLPLKTKIKLSQQRIREWYEAHDGEVYVAVSGGKDSLSTLSVVRELYPDVEGVFVDTLLEYPENIEVIKNLDNIKTIKTEKPYPLILKNYRFPVVSKKVSRIVRTLQNPTDNNKATTRLFLEGIDKKGNKCPTWKIPEKWKFLINAPFKISEQCCDYIKKSPSKIYSKKTGKKPILGILADDSQFRELGYLKYGCNAFQKEIPTSNPLGFWTEQDILEYIIKKKLPLSKIYGDIKKNSKGYHCTGVKRTGCMFCMFGVHLEDFPNRFQRMEESHPKQWNMCKKLKTFDVLDFIGIESKKDQKQFEDFET